MSTHIADPNRLRQLAKDLVRYEEQIKAEGQRLRSAFARAGWSDSEGRRFEDALKQMVTNLERSARTAGDLSSTARDKASALDRYLQR